jgi:hypothetical protein
MLSQGLRMVIFRTIAFSQIGFVLLFGSNRLTQNFILSQYIYNKLSQLERSSRGYLPKVKNINILVY